SDFISVFSGEARLPHLAGTLNLLELFSIAPRQGISPMSSLIICPHCNRKLKVPETMAGKTCRCPTCKSLLPAADEPGDPAPSGAVKATPAPRSAAVPSRSRPPRDEKPEEDIEPEEEEPIREKRPRKKRPIRKKSSTGPIIGLVAGGVLLLLVLGS